MHIHMQVKTASLKVIRGSDVLILKYLDRFNPIAFALPAYRALPVPVISPAVFLSVVGTCQEIGVNVANAYSRTILQSVVKSSNNDLSRIKIIICKISAIIIILTEYGTPLHFRESDPSFVCIGKCFFVTKHLSFLSGSKVYDL